MKDEGGISPSECW